MINLLPEPSKRRVRLEYRWRFFEAAGFVIIALAVAALVLLLPSEISLSFQTASAKTELLSAQNELAVLQKDTQTQSVIQSVEVKLGILRGVTPSLPELYPLIASVLSRQTSGIAVGSIAFDRSDSDGSSRGKINLQGISDDRTHLLAFVASLEGDPHFLKVDSPIDNLVKSHAIPFTIYLYVR